MVEYAYITVHQTVKLPLYKGFTNFFMWLGDPSVSRKNEKYIKAN